MVRIAAQINLKTLVENFSKIKKRAAAGVRIMAVVKADAYGHGAVAIAKKLSAEGVDFFGVASLAEAQELRDNKIPGEILILSEPATAEFNSAKSSDYIFTVYTSEFLKLLSQKNSSQIKIHIKVDTGMHRLGLPASAVADFIKQAQQYKNIIVEGIFTHLACADQPEHNLNQIQLKTFGEIVKEIKNQFPQVKYFHALNSAGLINFPEHRYNLVRVGIALYKNVMSLKARVLQVKTLVPGESVSYGATFTAKDQLQVAIISAGYADGYNRLLSNQGEVLIKGHRYPLVGRVCMDMSIINVTGGAVQVGDEVILMGQAGTQCISAEDLAGKIGTIDYEIMCAVSKRVAREYQT